jgi:hypothetical protein
MSEKIACFFLNITNHEGENFKKDDFFAPNSVNSFKKWHPEIEIIYVTNDNMGDYLKRLNITEYYDSVGHVRVHIIKELMKQENYTKIIMLGLDTFTCALLDEFLNNTTADLICSSGPPYPFLKTEYWAPKIIEFEYNNKTYQDVDFINADVVCFNSLKGAEMVYKKSLEFWTGHAEQGGMNYCYQNQKDLDIVVEIVDFPYITSNSLYNVRSKGQACGGNQMHQGKLYSGNYKDPNSRAIGNVYPTYEYYIKDNKLFTKDNKQIKVFHYAEALGVKTKEEYNETLYEIKNKWFNSETIKFLETQCNCNFN